MLSRVKAQSTTAVSWIDMRSALLSWHQMLAAILLPHVPTEPAHS